MAKNKKKERDGIIEVRVPKGWKGKVKTVSTKVKNKGKGNKGKKK